MSRLWTTRRGVPVAQEDMARGEDDIAELHRLSAQLIERTRVVVEQERLMQAQDRVRLLRALSYAAEQYARAAFHQITDAFAVIRMAHEHCEVSAESMTAIIQQALDARKNPRIFRGQAAESWYVDVARRWVDEALRSAVSDTDIALMMSNTLSGEGGGLAYESPVAAVEQASEAVTQAVENRNAAIGAAAAARITQGRVSQLLYGA